VLAVPPPSAQPLIDLAGARDKQLVIERGGPCGRRRLAPGCRSTVARAAHVLGPARL